MSSMFVYVPCMMLSSLLLLPLAETMTISDAGFRPAIVGRTTDFNFVLTPEVDVGNKHMAIYLEVDPPGANTVFDTSIQTSVSVTVSEASECILKGSPTYGSSTLALLFATNECNWPAGTQGTVLINTPAFTTVPLGLLSYNLTVYIFDVATGDRFDAGTVTGLTVGPQATIWDVEVRAEPNTDVTGVVPDYWILFEVDYPSAPQYQEADFMLKVNASANPVGPLFNVLADEAFSWVDGDDCVFTYRNSGNFISTANVAWFEVNQCSWSPSSPMTWDLHLDILPLPNGPAGQVVTMTLTGWSPDGSVQYFVTGKNNPGSIVIKAASARPSTSPSLASSTPSPSPISPSLSPTPFTASPRVSTSLSASTSLSRSRSASRRPSPAATRSPNRSPFPSRSPISPRSRSPLQSRSPVTSPRASPARPSTARPSPSPSPSSASMVTCNMWLLLLTIVMLKMVNA